MHFASKTAVSACMRDRIPCPVQPTAPGHSLASGAGVDNAVVRTPSRRPVSKMPIHRPRSRINSRRIRIRYRQARNHLRISFAQKETPAMGGGFGVKTLAMTYSRMLDAHYHRRMYVSLPSSEWDRVVPYSYSHQGEGGGSPIGPDFDAVLRSKEGLTALTLSEVGK